MANNPVEHYVNLYKQVYTQDACYGTTSIHWLTLVQHYVADLNPDSILDFGCGKSPLIEHIKTERDIPRYRYDPAISKYADIPIGKAGMVINIDVMEHIPEDVLENVLQNIRSLSDKVLFIISCQPAWYNLPDGSNAHCTVHPPEWWEEQLKEHFGYVERLALSSRKIAMFVTWQVKSHFTPHKTLLNFVHHLMIKIL